MYVRSGVMALPTHLLPRGAESFFSLFFFTEEGVVSEYLQGLACGGGRANAGCGVRGGGHDVALGYRA